MTPEQLKASILQYAIQGKLVEQRAEEGTGEELYQQIQAEKRRLIQEKKIKKEKPLAEISEDEIPFDIPESWKWVSVGSVCVNIQYGSSQKSSATGKVPVLRMGNIQNGRLVWDKLVYTSDDEEIAKYPLQYNDLLFNRTNSKELVGKTAIYKSEFPAIYAGYLVRVTPLLMCSDYLNYVMQSQFYWSYCQTVRSDAIGQSNINAEKLKRFVFPLPPLAEQKRIVAKIEELLPLVDRYAASYEKLEQFIAKFPEDMKKSILQYAIQGKLVEQRAEEGTGEELDQQIQVKKQRLIAEKKIKKEKPLAEISEDEIPFDIPESWKWVRVGEIFAHNTGKAMNSTAKKVDKPGSVKRFITTSNLYWNFFDFSSVKEMFFSDDELERCTVTKGDLLMCEGGAYYGRTAIWNYDYDICFQNHVHRLRPYKAVELRFFYHLFYFYKSMNMMNAKGTAMPGLSSQTLHQMVVPLPPLSEQKRIVAKIEELLPLCERLR